MLSVATTPPPRPAAAAPPPAACTERFHERLKASTKAWREMALTGFMTGHPSTDLYELRSCGRCGSTLARAVKIVKLQYVRMPRIAVATAPRRAARARFRVADTHTGGDR